MTMSEYKKTKYGYFFDFLDTTKKGYITQSNVIDNIMTLKTINNSADEDYVNLRKEQLSWWALYIDIAEKNEGRVERDSFVHANFEFLKDGANRDSVERYYTAMFNFIDQDKNGEISPEEFSIYYKSHNWTDEVYILELFQRIDLNKNGVITKDEFINAGMNFWYSDDPKNGFEFLHKPALK